MAGYLCWDIDCFPRYQISICTQVGQSSLFDFPKSEEPSLCKCSLENKRKLETSGRNCRWAKATVKGMSIELQRPFWDKNKQTLDFLAIALFGWNSWTCMFCVSDVFFEFHYPTRNMIEAGGDVSCILLVSTMRNHNQQFRLFSRNIFCLVFGFFLGCISFCQVFLSTPNLSGQFNIVFLSVIFRKLFS